MTDLVDGRVRHATGALPPEQPIETGRYLDALRRSKLLIAAIILLLTSTVFLVSTALPKTYRATAKIVVGDAADPLQTGDEASLERRLATITALLETRETMRRARRRVPGATVAALGDKVSSSVDPAANIINVVATDASARRAARIANAVAVSFVADQRAAERRRLNRARATLQAALDELEGKRGVQVATERASIRERLTDLNVAATNRAELELAEAARPPTTPYAPRPLRNSLFAFFASAFIAALVVLARAQLKPRVTNTRELGRLLELPVLTEVPHVRRGLGHRPQTVSSVEYEAYQTLQASIRRKLPPTSQRIVLVTSALHGEGKTEVTAALGLVLSQAGLRTWLVSADMRWPKLHELFDVEQTPGLAEVLAGRRNGGSERIFELSAARSGSGLLHVLASGRTPRDPAQLLSSDALDGFFDEVRQSEYDYVLLDGPPLLGLVDSQVLAQRVDGVLIVCRPDRQTPQTALAMRELLDRLEVDALGLAIVGARGSTHVYLPG
jgi:capsular exopolysaccharide synthesis family protein